MPRRPSKPSLRANGPPGGQAGEDGDGESDGVMVEEQFGSSSKYAGDDGLYYPPSLPAALLGLDDGSVGAPSD